MLGLGLLGVLWRRHLHSPWALEPAFCSYLRIHWACQRLRLCEHIEMLPIHGSLTLVYLAYSWFASGPSSGRGGVDLVRCSVHRLFPRGTYQSTSPRALPEELRSWSDLVLLGVSLAVFL